MSIYDKKYQEAFDRLNEKQRAAVEQIYGPVMVVAGPGTGKTQLLAVRIGHILKSTDTDIRNILCMTFTEIGSHEMRDRLKSFVGPTAYDANIYTYHAFCNEVILSNPEYFGGFRDLQPASDLELVDVFQELIDAWPVDHPLKRYRGNLYGEKRRLQSLFSTMKQEGWTYNTIKNAIDGLEDFLRGTIDNPDYDYHYKRKYSRNGVSYQAGDFKQDKFDKYKAKFENLLVAAAELDNYDRILAQKDRYDYNDMILWVIKAFKENPDLLADYQERYQFLLVDEYQDTNGTQNELLFLLADNPIDDKPNVFIVGDDDQAIFRFQGANMNNIIDFADKYEPFAVVLSNNYRSYQGILDSSKALIEHNEQRLVRQDDTLQKELIESRLEKNQGADPVFLNYKNPTQEEWGVIKQILELKAAGTPLNEIAVIYRSHKDVSNIVQYLALNDIPLNVKKRTNVLQQQDIKRLLTILSYIDTEYRKPFAGNEAMIYEMMHYDYFDISARDAGLVALHCSNRTDTTDDDKRWRSVLSDEVALAKANVSETDKILKLGSLIESWISAIPNVSIQVLFERILTESGALDEVLRSEDMTWRLQVINCFFDLIKKEAEKYRNFDLSTLLDTIHKMEENTLELPLTKITYSEKGVNFVTAHGSKGLEFEHVFIIKATQETWVKKAFYTNKFKFPDTLVPISDKSDVEDDRRLFYVAMTRAKDHLYISFAKQRDDENPLTKSIFVEEISQEGEIVNVDIHDEELLAYKASLMRFEQGEVSLIDHDLIDRVLSTFKMSSTSLNKYLRCPVAFYFENILRVPMARTASMGYGNAVHYALEGYFNLIEKDPQRAFPSTETLHKLYADGMKRYHSHFTEKEYVLNLEHGKQVLTDYVAAYQADWSLPRKFETEYRIDTEYTGIPITGNIDRIDVYDDHVSVTDYKTGKYASASSKLNPPKNDDDGGDYWRQIVFYYLLLHNDRNHAGRMRNGIMSFVEKDKKSDQHRNRIYEVAPFEVDIVVDQLQKAYSGIQEHRFEEGCNDEKCGWCNFVKTNLPASMPKMSEDNPE